MSNRNSPSGCYVLTCQGSARSQPIARHSLLSFDSKLVVHSRYGTLSAEDMVLGYKQLQRVEESNEPRMGSAQNLSQFFWRGSHAVAVSNARLNNGSMLK